MFYIDSTQWPYPIDVTRNPDLRASDVSGQMLDGTYYNDVLGTFMNYTVRMAVPLNQRQLYNTIYGKLLDPVDAHEFILPDSAGGHITFTGYVSGLSDVYVRMPDGTPYWRGIQFNITANTPRKKRTINQAIQSGRTIFPDIAEHNEGDTWVWTNGRWELSVHYDNADEKHY